MKDQISQIVTRLKNPAVVLSISSQVISIFILMGYTVNESKVLTMIAICCSILAALGIMSNPDTRGYRDQILHCERCGVNTLHMEVAGKTVCTQCGTVHTAGAAG